jgi:hypothetical protein
MRIVQHLFPADDFGVPQFPNRRFLSRAFDILIN